MNCDIPRQARRNRGAVALIVAAASLLPLGIAAAETADEFVARLNKEFADIGLELNAAGWTQATYVTVDTELLNARVERALPRGLQQSGRGGEASSKARR